MSDHIAVEVVKNDTDEGPEEGEIQDDEELEDVSSDDEISTVTKKEESLMFPHPFVKYKSKIKRLSIVRTPRKEMRFHLPDKTDHICQSIQKRSRPCIRSGGHDNYYDMPPRYKNFKDIHPKGRIHEKENKARETKKLYKKSSLHSPTLESRSGYISSTDRGDGRFSSTSSKGTWHKCELKEKHKKKKKSKNNKSCPLLEVHESQVIQSKETNVTNECIKNSTNVEENVCEKNVEGENVEKDMTVVEGLTSPTGSDIEILDVPVRIPEVITIGDSDDDAQHQKVDEGIADLNVDITSHDVTTENNTLGEPLEMADVSKDADSADMDENLELLREAALNSSKSDQPANVNPDDEVLQLRLAALRSAIIRKYEERKKRGITLAKRGKNAAEKHVMSISPLSSPNHCSSRDSFNQTCDEIDLFLSSGEFNGSCDPPDLENDSEIDKITAVDMELVESDEEKEQISVHSGEVSNNDVIVRITDDYNTGDDVDKHSAYVATSVLLHCVSASQSPMTPRVEITDDISGYIIGDYDHTTDSEEPVLPPISACFDSQLVGDSINQESEINKPSVSIQPDSNSCVLQPNLNANCEVSVREEVKNQSESSITGVDTFESGIIIVDKDPNSALLTTEDSNDSCSTRDLDLESMIVLDEVGKCSDDSKSEGSAMDVSSGIIDILCPNKSSSIHAALKNCEVNSHSTNINCTNVRKHASVCRDGSVNSTSASSEKRSDKIANGCDVMNSIGPPTFQCPVEPSNSILGSAHKNNLLGLLENVNNKCDERLSNTCGINHISSGKRENVDNSTRKISYMNLSDQCNSNECLERSGEEDGSYLNIVASDLSCELSNSPGLGLMPNYQKPVVARLCVQDGNLKYSGEESMPHEFCPETQDHNRFATDSPANGKIVTGSDSDCSNGKNEVCGVKSNAALGITSIHNESHGVYEQLKYNNKGNNAPNLTSICMEEDEEVLRLRALAMLNKKSEDLMLLCSSPQNCVREKEPVNASDLPPNDCDLVSAENGSVRQEADMGLLPLPSNITCAKNLKVMVPVKRTLPSKSSCTNQKNYAHHMSLPHSKLAYPSRNKLSSVNKMGSKSSKSRILKNNATVRSSINVPELVINLGEDSDSGDDTVHEFSVVGKDPIESKKTLDNQSGVQAVSSDFAKKLDLLLKQARFEQEIITNEEKDDNKDNVPFETVNSSTLPSKVPSENTSQSLTSENIVKSSTVHSSTLDKPSENSLKGSASVTVMLSNFAANGSNSGSVKEIVSTNRGDSNKLSSSTNRKAVIAHGKKSVSSVSSHSPPAMSIVDIGLLPSNKQEEYIRLKTQLAQLVGRGDAKAKGSFEWKKFLERQKKVDSILQASLKRNIVKNNIGANVDRSLITRKSIRRVQVGSQVIRNDFAKARRLVKTIANVNNSPILVPDRLVCSSLSNSLSPQECAPVSTVPAQGKKVISAKTYVRKGTLNTQSSVTIKPRTSAQICVGRLSVTKIPERSALSLDKCVSKVIQNRTVVGTVSVAQDSGQGSKCFASKRKKSISESCEVSLCKKCPVEPQTVETFIKSTSGKGEVCSTGENSEIGSPAQKTLADELWTTENKLMAKRYQVLEDIAAVRLNLHEIEKVNLMKQQILTDIKILKEKMSLAESQLSQKEELLNSLYTEVEDAKRNIMRRQSETLLLSVECEEKGCKVHGSNYSVPNMCSDMIRNGMLSISETLQNLNEGRVSVESFSGISPICSSGEQGMKEDNGLLPISDLIENNNEELNKQVQHSYSSPLDAMRTESGSDSQAVLCPYHIMGSCKDKECSYLH